MCIKPGENPINHVRVESDEVPPGRDAIEQGGLEPPDAGLHLLRLEELRERRHEVGHLEALGQQGGAMRPAQRAELPPRTRTS